MGNSTSSFTSAVLTAVVLVCGLTVAAGQQLNIRDRYGELTSVPITAGTKFTFVGCDSIVIWNAGSLQLGLSLNSTQNFTFDECDSTATSVEEEQQHSHTWLTVTAYPNPVNASTTVLNIHVPTEGTRAFGCRIYQLDGSLIKDLGVVTPISAFTGITWDLKDISGVDVLSGTYVIQIQFDDRSAALLISVIK